MDDLLKLGKEILAAQPFSRHVGAELTQFSEGRAELTIPMAHHLEQQNGFVHGGVISYAADNVLTFAGGSALGPKVLTSEYKINYLKPAVGSHIIARATVISSSKNQAVCRCEIFAVNDGKESLCAAAQGTISKFGEP
ncbi:MAG TPA: PaaI family thioesterase [Desulfosalsimonadaceae bacterium]|nr:PaaI family thioesterase [Desulfosalsimonadaceae bacterium]